MKEFRDNQGKRWQINMTIGACQEIKTLYGVDLLRPEGTPDNSGGSLLERVMSDSLFDYKIAIRLCKASIKENGYDGYTDEQLGELFGAEEYKLLIKAFYDEYADFFHQAGAKGAAALVAKIQEIKGLRDDALAARVNLIDLNEEEENETETSTSGQESGNGQE